MADAKSLRMEAARKALDKLGGQSVYPRSFVNELDTYDPDGRDGLQFGLIPTLSASRPTSKAEDRLHDKYIETGDLYDEIFDPRKNTSDERAKEVFKELSDREYVGLDDVFDRIKHPAGDAFNNPVRSKTMEDYDYLASNLVDRGSHGDLRPEMAELALRDAIDADRAKADAEDFSRDIDKGLTDLVSTTEDVDDIFSGAEGYREKLRQRVKDSLLGR